MQDALERHLKTGSTTICRTWLVRRKDGVTLGFTDHDCDLRFEDTLFAARSGLTAGVLEKTSGLAVDNSEVLGALSDDSISDADITAGRYDGAEVVTYLVNWANVDERMILFRGTIGEITRRNGTFKAELRGLTEGLNTRTGRVYHSDCNAVLGDRQCGIDLGMPEFSVDLALVEITNGHRLHFENNAQFAAGWFTDGRAIIKTGIGKDQSAMIKSDRIKGNVRMIELWQTFRQVPDAFDMITLVAGCDRRAVTCKKKFQNFLNFRGFPYIPGEDWLRSSPGASRRR